MPSIRESSQLLESDDPVVDLFVIDGTGIPGGSVYRFTPGTAECSLGGNVFQPFPIGFQGAEMSSTGTQPRPTLTVSNVFGTLLNDIVQQDDFSGYKVVRMRTLASKLDDGADPDDSEFLAYDSYIVENISSWGKQSIVWQLASPLERLGMKLPRRQATKDPSPLTPRGFPGMSRNRTQ